MPTLQIVDTMTGSIRCFRVCFRHLLLELLDQLFYLIQAAAAMCACAGCFLNSFQCCVSSFYCCLDVAYRDIAAEAYGFIQIHVFHLPINRSNARADP